MKEPELSFFQQLLAFAMLAGLGGVVHYLTTLKTGKNFKWPSFFIELICSAFVGKGHVLFLWFHEILHYLLKVFPIDRKSVV